jgi:hypothetical protein
MMCSHVANVAVALHQLDGPAYKLVSSWPFQFGSVRFRAICPMSGVEAPRSDRTIDLNGLGTNVGL